MGLRTRRLVLDAMMKGAKTDGANVFSKGLCVAHHCWRIAYQTDRGRHDQESHDQQKPPTIVNMPDRELVEQGKPEGAELVDVVVGRLILLKRCADQARPAK